MTSIDILMDKIAKLEHADAIQNSKIKQLEIECSSLRSMLDDTRKEGCVGTCCKKLVSRCRKLVCFYGMVNDARRTTKTTAIERRKNVGCYNGAPQTVRTSYK